jgi:hypothetical protein
VKNFALCLHRTHRCIGRDSGARIGASELAQEPQKLGVLGAARESLFGDVPRGALDLAGPPRGHVLQRRLGRALGQPAAAARRRTAPGLDQRRRRRLLPARHHDRRFRRRRGLLRPVHQRPHALFALQPALRRALPELERGERLLKWRQGPTRDQLHVGVESECCAFLLRRLRAKTTPIVSRSLRVSRAPRRAVGFSPGRPGPASPGRRGLTSTAYGFASPAQKESSCPSSR